MSMGPNMGEPARRVLNDALEERSDFKGKCVKCGEQMVGSLQMMREHECEGEADEQDQ